MIKVGASVRVYGKYGKLVYIYETDSSMGRVVFEDGSIEDVQLWKCSEVIT